MRYIFFLVLCSCAAQLLAQSARERLEAIAHIEQKHMVPMRDGIRLATDVYRPKTNEPVPVIFSRTPYNFNGWGDGEERMRVYERAMTAVQHGYAYVVQNERGRYFSEGDWDILGVPLTDAYDAFTWMAEQEWSNGHIGLLGCSSTAEWQMAAASMGHPALKAIVPQGFGAGVGRVGEYYEQGNWYRGGAQQMLFTSWLYSVQHDPMAPRLPEGIAREDLLRLQRFYDMSPEYPRQSWKEGLAHLPVEDIIEAANGPRGIYEEMITRKPNDPAWYEGGLYHDDMVIQVPGFWFVSWFDVSSSPNLALFNHVRENAAPEVRDDQYLVVAPTLHCRYTRATENTMVGDLNVGDARLNYEEQIYAFFDKHLKPDVAGANPPRIQYYTMGTNEWQEAETWPPENVETVTYFLESRGRANTMYGDGRLSTQQASRDNSDTYVYDPMNPVPSYGGNVCCTGDAIEGGSYDQRIMETRNDILVYTTEPLQEGIEVSGFIESSIYVSSDAADTDFTIKLIDVHPDGTAYNLDETIQRARYRDGYDKEVFMEDGEVYKVDFTPMSTSNYFAAGHRIRIEISSSNFPRFTRNLNTGGNNYDESEGIIATNTIHHSRAYPSSISLPVVR
ncbi:MAG: CocE/NonD family hydrolase [Bacteroidota bacterium]